MGIRTSEIEPKAGLLTARIVASSADVPIYLSLATRVDALGLGPEMRIRTENDGSKSTLLIEGTSAPLDVLRQALGVRQEAFNQHLRDLALEAEMDIFFARLKFRFPDSQQAA